MITTIVARDLPEAWYLCVREIMAHGYEYVITRGSHVEASRKELDSVVLEVLFPGSRPMVPDVPQGVPPPCSMDYVEKYLPYLMTGSKEKNEIYTYGEDIDKQLPVLIKILKEAGEGTNQACMTVGFPGSILLEHSQCLRVIDTRIRNGKLHFHVYFRSWDLWGGFPANLAAIAVLQRMMAEDIGVKIGEIIASSKGLHLYGYVEDLAKIRCVK